MNARFVYTKTVIMHTKAHENVFILKSSPKWKLLKNETYSVNTTKMGVKSRKTLPFFSKHFCVNEAQMFIIKCVRLVNEGRLLLVIECDGCGF